MLLKLLGMPITGPIAGFRFIMQQIETMAEQELYSEEHIMDDLLLLQSRLDDGEISEEEYTQQEAEIFARLREARARRGKGPIGNG
ncbi:MAG TPA: gas vesicle protein GvpG [Chloroflexota bacterium]|jgi:uncharacterized membrane protein